MYPETLDVDKLPLYGVNVRDYGATGNGIEDDAPSIQAALNAGAEEVIVPLGVYKIGHTLRVPSSTRLVVHKAARLFLADDAGTDESVFLLSNANPRNGNHDVVIQGGVWDGNNLNNPRGPDQPGSYTGVLINFSNVTGLRLRDMTVRNPESYFIRLAQRVSRFRVENIRFEALSIRPNQDGVHLGGYCEDGIIRNLEGIGISTPNDDVIALNADDANDRAQNLGKVCGPISRVRVENITASDCHTFVRCASVWHAVEDIEIEDVSGGCAMSLLNVDAARYCRVPPFDPDDPACAEGVGELRNIRVRNVNVYKSQKNDKPLIHLECRPYKLYIEQCHRDVRRDASPDAPTLYTRNLQPDVPVLLEGLDISDGQYLLRQSKLGSTENYRECRPDGLQRMRLETVLPVDGCISLQNGGFDAVSFNV